MPNITIKDITYELVTTLDDNMASVNVLQTIVEEGETPEKKYRLNLMGHCPITLSKFETKEDVENWCVYRATKNHWSPYFEDAAPEEEGE